MTSQTVFTPFREPLRSTLCRTGLIAIGISTVMMLPRTLAPRWSEHTLGMWLVGIAAALWFTFGGHWVEVWFLNWLRPRLRPSRPTHVAARLAVWFAGGSLLFVGMATTMRLLGSTPPALTLWVEGGLLFILVEMVFHFALLQARGLPSFWNGRG